MRGGVSHTVTRAKARSKSSPHARGCFLMSLHSWRLAGVFPACAGVFLEGAFKDAIGPSLPRMRGGVSGDFSQGTTGWRSSPHARGCFSSVTATKLTIHVFPACAGVFPPALRRGELPNCLPRMRGGVSTRLFPTALAGGSSPHARGCFCLFLYHLLLIHVFPACAGVFPTHLPPLHRQFCLPRMRGGVSIPCHS